ncbi:MAG TPA: ParB/RepB/Spo0J family partition protein [Blastocatellia bacterium]|nr:ParB/RepB/Spo0J family partition protein [Blastocatellia bacterium]
MATRRALGRGLSALLADNPETGKTESSEDQKKQTGEELLEIDVDLIDPNPAQPRLRFSEERLEELAQSIRSNGLVQPILVRKSESNRYQIIAGERRWRAAQRAGLHRISAVVRNIPETNLLELALIENIQRQELNPVEEAQAYQRLINSLGATQDELARRVGKDRSSIANSLRLLKLPTPILCLVEDEKLTMGHARALLSLESEETQERAAREIIQRRLSVRETERMVKRLTSGEAVKGVSTPVRNDANIRAAELRLKRLLGTQVRIQLGQQGGKLEIEFSSMGELDRIYSIIMRKSDPVASPPESG